MYVNTAKQVGDKDHLKVFATVEAAEIWFEENDPEGVAFEYDVIGRVGYAIVNQAQIDSRFRSMRRILVGITVPYSGICR